VSSRSCCPSEPNVHHLRFPSTRQHYTSISLPSHETLVHRVSVAPNDTPSSARPLDCARKFNWRRQSCAGIELQEHRSTTIGVPFAQDKRMILCICSGTFFTIYGPQKCLVDLPNSNNGSSYCPNPDVTAMQHNSSRCYHLCFF
jgi:hypothetical protein